LSTKPWDNQLAQLPKSNLGPKKQSRSLAQRLEPQFFQLQSGEKVCIFALSHTFHNSPAMMTPPDKEGLHIIPPEKPPPHLLYSAELRAAKSKTPEEEPETKAVLKGSGFFWNNTTAWIGAILLALILIGAGSGYVIEQRYKKVVPVAVPPPPPRVQAIPPIRVTPDMLNVSAISLGTGRLAIVNNKRLGEGDSLTLHTPTGIAILRLITIDDGLVRFEYGGQIFEAKLTSPVTAKKSP
jgi:hypothetical protein